MFGIVVSILNVYIRGVSSNIIYIRNWRGTLSKVRFLEI